MDPIRYTGRHGIAKLDPKDGAESNADAGLLDPKDGVESNADTGLYLQKTFFKIFGNEGQGAAPNFEPPIAKQRSTKRRDRSVKQQYLEFEDLAERAEIQPTEPGFTALRVPLPIQVSDVLLLPDGSQRRLPQTTAELIHEFGLSALNEAAIIGVPGQLKAVTRTLVSRENLAFQGRTGSGKTFVELMIASHYLSKGERVLLLAPTEILVHQHKALAESVLSLPNGSICGITGQTEWRKRAPFYLNPKHLLYVSTPETLVNDVERGILDPNLFKLVLYDEGHRAVGQYAYVRFDKQLPDSTRRIVFSATLASNFHDLAALHERLGISACHEIVVAGTARFVTTVSIGIRKEENPVMYEASKLLFNAVVKCALKFDSCLARATEYRDGVLGYGRLVKTFRKMTNVTACRKMLSQSESHNTAPLSTPFNFPSFKEFNSLGASLRELSDKSPSRFGGAVSEWYELQYLMLLYSTLTCEGQYCFLNMAGQKLWSIRFAGYGSDASSKAKKDAPRNFHRRVFSSPDVIKAFAQLSQGTHFFQLQFRTKEQFSGLVSSVFPEGIPERPAPKGKGKNKDTQPKDNDREYIRKQFFAAARQQMVERDYVDHPQEHTARMLVQRHCTFGRSEPIFVYNASAQGTLFYMDRLAHHLAKAGIKAASVVGKKHLSSAERDENLTLFDKHEVQVLGINSAANEGLHMQAANTLVRLSHSSRPIDIEQVLGRVGRKDRPAYIYNVVTIGTHDEYRFYAGLRNQKRMRQAIQTAQGLMFTGPGSLEE